MKTLLEIALTIMYIVIMCIGLWVFFTNTITLFEGYRTAIRLNKPMDWADVKKNLLTLAAYAGLMLIVPVVFITALDNGFQIAMPAMDSLSTTLSTYMLKIVNTAGENEYSPKVFEVDGAYEQVAPTPPPYIPQQAPQPVIPQAPPNPLAGQSGGGAPLVPNPTPQVLMPPTPQVTQAPPKTLNGD